VTTPGPRVDFFGLNLAAPAVALKFRGMYDAMFRGLGASGASVRYASTAVSPDAEVVITSPSWPRQDLELVAETSAAPVVLYVPPSDVWFDRPLLDHYASRLLFAYGTARSEETAERYRRAGLAYHVLPLATDPELMRPLGIGRPYDLVFVGGLEHRVGTDAFVERLLASAGGGRDLLLCTGGERFGIPTQTASWGEVLNLVYNAAKVGVNVHSREQKRGPAQQQDVNNRLFDLAAAGCFQVSDNVTAVRELFGEDEVLAFDDAAQWIEAARHYCRHPDEADEHRRRARDRVMRDHTWTHRGRTLLGWIEDALATHSIERRPLGPPRWLHARRRLGAGLRRLGVPVRRGGR
jgi:hypothetical protein